ncbi:CPS_HP_G0127300.mRNA.1.CDS.1 [Saccharomyces cerevisiae]|nr:ATV_HP_G0127690.mRNA.1.CDS.1 [Saccharomyces cerevisiae]CAI4997508.1 CPS_HP_G0073300.mRNA.1.CDS.1 [Saccharomyces cerevisiae]CAI5002145.1 CPS_HP_G0077450.mRNA.1.CDS.1 [Saccharomyces cerevisiae]CAI5102891.1 CPS_HP_G0127300.mRNA.1.CDS.1 [Saccharomyces cerevisiae]CAI6838461.1 ATV_HP_G0127690.mRNA.1.CDS.1 [Saccharomyces cerevisiae]
MSVQDTKAVEFSMGHIRSSSVSLVAEATSNTNSEDKLSKIQLYEDLCRYEDTLSKLVESVDRFKPNLDIAKDLIRTDEALFENVKLLAEYDNIYRNLQKIDKDSEELDSKTRKILEILNECHDELKALPMLEQVEFEKNTILQQRSKINSTELLDYATKLSKFTKIPPTFDKGAVGPNNFIWPAEDALRRGMLAMASLHSKELTRIPGEEVEETEVPTVPPSQSEEQKGQMAKKEGTPKTDSFIFDGTAKEVGDEADNTKDKEKEENNDDALDLDLDLFDPDDF